MFDITVVFILLFSCWLFHYIQIC